MPQQEKYFPVFFSPDGDAAWDNNPGALTSVTDLVPSKRGSLVGYVCGSSLQVSGNTFDEATYGKPVAGRILKQNDGTARMFVGTRGRIMENTVASGWLDRSRGTNYSASTTNWSFCGYGNVTIACNKLDATQYSTTGAFADLSGAPKANLCCTQANFVMLADYDDGTNTYGDGWYCSGLADYTHWTNSIASQSASGRLLATPGKITALVPVRDGIVAFKEDSIYIGEYVGPPVVWSWRLISDHIGCSAPNGVAVVNGVLYFIHRTGPYKFDGSYPQAIGQAVNQHIANTLADQSKYALFQAGLSEYANVIFWYMRDPTNDATTPIAWAYNYVTGKWGYITHPWDSGTTLLRCVVQCSLADIASWRSALGANQFYNVVLIGQSSGTTIGIRVPTLYSTGGASPTYTTGGFCDQSEQLKVTRVHPKGTADSANTLTVTPSSDRYTSGTPVTFAISSNSVRFDGLATGRYHVINGTLGTSTAQELYGLTIRFVPAGSE